MYQRGSQGNRGLQPESRYDLDSMGVVFGENSRFVLGSKGVMELNSLDGSWKPTGDFTRNVWSVTLGAGGALDTLMVFRVKPETADFVLSLPEFTPILLDK
jgi:hypothetical protein